MILPDLDPPNDHDSMVMVFCFYVLCVGIGLIYWLASIMRKAKDESSNRSRGKS